MEISNKLIKEALKNVYFISGTAYAGKSTVCKMLANKYNMIHCEENYKFGDFLKLTTPQTHPNMNYFNTKSSWEEFVSRSKEDYYNWMVGTARETTEFEILHLLSLPRDQKVIVDTNIPHNVLKEISDYNRVVYMVATPEISTNQFFNRKDAEKQFLYKVIKNSSKPEENMKKFRDSLMYINSLDVINEYINTGYYVIKREHLDDDVNHKLKLVEEHFKLN